MSAQHTPGPWTFEPAMGGVSGEPLRLCFYTIDGPEGTVASTWAGAHEANARLIAAAPELLDAHKPNLLLSVAEELVMAADRVADVALAGMLRERAKDCLAAEQLSRAAIDKATGE